MAPVVWQLYLYRPMRSVLIHTTILLWVTLHLSYKKQELLAFTGTWVPGFPGLIGRIRGAHIFTFLWCDMC
jgi:hypothetical protein